MQVPARCRRVLPRMRPVFTALRHRCQRLSLVAFLAIFGLAFAPTISHALAHGGGSAWSEVCTPQGTKLVTAADGSSDGGQPATTLDHMTHCPLCGLSATPFAVPVVAPVSIEPAGLSHLLPTLFLSAPRPLFAWAASQPRGPPVFS